MGTVSEQTETPTEETKVSYDGAEIRGARHESKEVKEDKEDKTEPERDPSKPAGYYPVDFETASKEEIKDRYDYLYRQIKDQKKTDRTLKEYRDIASQQAKQIEELTQGFNGVVHHLQDKNLNDSEESLTEQMNTAFERGDNKAYLAAQKKLIDLGVQKHLLAKPAQVTPQTTTQRISAAEMATQAQNQGDLTDEETRSTIAWQNETDGSGNTLRPWSQGEHPLFEQALNEARAVFSNPRFAHQSHEAKLEEVDRRMGLAKRVTAQTVTGGGLTGRGKISKITLTPDIERLAIRTKFGGPKAKSDAEHIEAYRKQLLKVKGKR